MTKALDNYLITLQVAFFCMGLSVIAISLPSKPQCIVKFDSGTEQRCSHFEQAQDCNCGDDGDEENALIASRENILEVTVSSLQFSSQLRNNKVVLRLAGNGADSTSLGKCWYLQAFNETPDSHEMESAQVFLSGLVPDFIAWNWTVYNASECSPEIKNWRLQQCGNFGNTAHTFDIFPKQREMRFKLHPVEPNASSLVLVELWSSSCPFDCNPLSTCELSCTQHEMDMTGTWESPIPIGFHCLRVSRIPSNGCVIKTETKELTAYISSDPVVESAWDHLLVPLGIATMSGVFVVAIMGTVCVLRGRRRSRAHFPHPGSVLYDALLKPTPQVFLLYSRDSPQLCAAVRAFKTILEKHITKVIDPFNAAHHDEILRNRESWLASLMADTNVKIVFILSEGAIFRQKALMAKKLVVSQDPHCLDSIFIDALNHMQHNMTLINDYRRIFSVRFEDTIAGDMNPGLTPLIRFTMLRDLGQLLAEIRGNRQNMWITDADETSPEYESFKSNIEDLKRMRKENTHILHSFVEKTI